jgi:hypothetical protein
MQEDLKAPIAPVVHFGPYELFPRKMKFCMPGHVVIRFLPNYTPEVRISSRHHICCQSHHALVVANKER